MRNLSTRFGIGHRQRAFRLSGRAVLRIREQGIGTAIVVTAREVYPLPVGQPASQTLVFPQQQLSGGTVFQSRVNADDPPPPYKVTISFEQRGAASQPLAELRVFALPLRHITL